MVMGPLRSAAVLGTGVRERGRVRDLGEKGAGSEAVLQLKACLDYSARQGMHYCLKARHG
jgi:hypothetical protein